MKTLTILAMCLLTLTACNMNNISQSSTSTQINLFQPIAITENHLEGAWRLAYSVKNGERHAPIKGDNGEALTIQFTQKDKRVTVLNGCNLMSGAYQIEQEQLKIGALMSTRKMCEPALMQVDSLAGKLLQTQNKFKLERFVDALPDAMEWVIEVDGEQYRFVKIKSS